MNFPRTPLNISVSLLKYLAEGIMLRAGHVERFGSGIRAEELCTKTWSTLLRATLKKKCPIKLVCLDLQVR